MLAAGINERLHSACYAPDAVKCSSKRGACTDSASESVEGRLSKKKPMFGAENVAFSTQASAFAQAPVPAIAPPPPAPTATAAHASAFRILRHIQTGGHGCVYEAVLGGGKAPQRVAIKTTLPDDIETCRELEAVGFLTTHPHENVLTYVRSPEIRGGSVFQYFPLCDDDAFNLAATSTSPRISERSAKKLCTELFNALGHCHDLGIVHRDVKPDNIMLLKGAVRLGDFGSACFIRPPPSPAAAAAAAARAPLFSPITSLTPNLVNPFSPIDCGVSATASVSVSPMPMPMSSSTSPVPPTMLKTPGMLEKLSIPALKLKPELEVALSACSPVSEAELSSFASSVSLSSLSPSPLPSPSPFSATPRGCTAHYGTVGYVPPEAISRNGSRDEKADVWGAAISIAAILSGNMLWERADDSDERFIAWCDAHAYRNIEALREIVGGDIHEECFDLLSKMLDPCPDTRITLAEARAHPWITGPVVA